MRCTVDVLGPILAIVCVVGVPMALVWMGLLRAALLSTGHTL
ncbi:MAG: hypothetical protein ACPG6R_05040 [Aequoribacter sp.]